MHLQPRNLQMREARHSQRSSNNFLLSGAIGRGQGARTSILVDSRAHNHSKMVLSAFFGGGFRWNDEHGAARITANIPISSGAQGLTATINAQHSSFLEHCSGSWCQHDVEATVESCRALPQSDAVDGGVQTDER